MRKLIFTFFILLGIGFYLVANAVTSGPNSPGTTADNTGVGTREWTTPQNATTSDNVWVHTGSVGGSATTTMHYLLANNFGFNLDSESIIDGIKLEIERHIFGDGDFVIDNIVSLVNSVGSVAGNNYASSTRWQNIGQAQEIYFSYGGENDLWGQSWTANDINDTDFGSVISVYIHQDDGGFASTARIDHVRITVYYHIPQSTGKLQIKTGKLQMKSGKMQVLR